MNPLTLSASQGDRLVLKCRPPRVYVDGARRRDLAVMKWELLPAPEFGSAVLVLDRRAAGGSRRLGDPAPLPRVGSNVEIRSAVEPCGERFLAVVTEHGFVVHQGTERLTAICRDKLGEALRTKVTDIWRLAGGALVEVKRARTHFNADRNSLATSSTVCLGRRMCRAFDSSLTARRWTVADALGYLLAATVPQAFETPSIEELDALGGQIDLGSLDVTGKSAAEAIAEVARRAGLQMRSGQEGESIVAFRPGVQGRGRNVRLQRAGASLDTTKSNLCDARINIIRRPARRPLLALGERKQYESTFELFKGWGETLQTGRWRDFVRSKSDNWAELACVYRKWVLNEHGWYSGSPWNLPVHDFSNISEEAFLVQRARRFLPCLSTDTHGQTLGTHVQFRCGSEGPWVRWRGPVWVSRHQCAIYLGGDSLPGEFFEAAVNNQVTVRATCVVEADQRIATEIPGDPNLPREVLDLSDRAAWRSVHESSVFRAAQGVGTPDERDDSRLLTHLARRRAEMLSTATEAELRLGWVDTSYRVGDIVERIEGREFELASSPDTRAYVKAVTHEFAAEQTTRLLVTG